MDLTINGTTDVPLPKTVNKAFSYDGFSRLTRTDEEMDDTAVVPAVKTGEYHLTMAYDELHNITSKVQSITTEFTNDSYNFGYDYTPRVSLKEPPQPHAPRVIGGRQYFYDLNGNQTGYTDGSISPDDRIRVLEWDEENRLTHVSDPLLDSVYKCIPVSFSVEGKSPYGKQPRSRK